jgi:hypothetical protein
MPETTFSVRANRAPSEVGALRSSVRTWTSIGMHPPPRRERFRSRRRRRRCGPCCPTCLRGPHGTPAYGRCPLTADLNPAPGSVGSPVRLRWSRPSKRLRHPMRSVGRGRRWGSTQSTCFICSRWMGGTLASSAESFRGLIPSVLTRYSRGVLQRGIDGISRPSRPRPSDERPSRASEQASAQHGARGTHVVRTSGGNERGPRWQIRSSRARTMTAGHPGGRQAGAAKRAWPDSPERRQ